MPTPICPSSGSSPVVVVVGSGLDSAPKTGGPPANIKSFINAIFIFLESPLVERRASQLNSSPHESVSTLTVRELWDVAVSGELGEHWGWDSWHWLEVNPDTVALVVAALAVPAAPPVVSLVTHTLTPQYSNPPSNAHSFHSLSSSDKHAMPRCSATGTLSTWTLNPPANPPCAECGAVNPSPMTSFNSKS